MKVRNWNNRAREIDLKSFDANSGFDRVPRGNGRNYGDAALGKTVADMRTHRQELKIENGCLVADTGWLLSDLLPFCVSQGFWFPVIPGTQYVTLGGMIAADVHGKDHVLVGTLGRWIRRLTVRLSDGTIVDCSPHQNVSLFRLTIGGMGSTGTILQAVIELERLTGQMLRQESFSCSTFAELEQLFEQSEARFSVAWADGFRKNRYLFSEASLIQSTEKVDLKMRGARFTIPQTGIRWVRTIPMRWYNADYYRRVKKKLVTETDPESYFFPLDRIGYWNRLYGKCGLVQYQFLVPKPVAASVWEYVRSTLEKAGFSAYLIVIKQHGSLESPGYLSFPAEGYSFAMDFPRKPELLQLLSELNQQIIAAGGRIYLTKDELLQPEELDQMYPLAKQFREELGNVGASPIRSSLGDRLNFYEMAVSSQRMQRTVFIIGANSDVGMKSAEHFRAAGCKVLLFGHKTADLPSGYDSFYLNVASPDLSVFEGKQTDIVLFTAGRLPNNEMALSGETLHETIAVNFTGNAQIAGYFAEKFRERGNGLIVGVSSVAAVRGKGSNVVYGAAKAGWDNYLSGLRNFLYPHGVRVLTIRPGYITSKMTEGMHLPKSLTASPEKVAAIIVRHSLRGKRSIVFVKPVWRFIAFAVKHLPEFLAKRLKW